MAIFRNLCTCLLQAGLPVRVRTCLSRGNVTKNIG